MTQWAGSLKNRSQQDQTAGTYVGRVGDVGMGIGWDVKSHAVSSERGDP